MSKKNQDQDCEHVTKNCRHRVAEVAKQDSAASNTNEAVEPKYGPMPRFASQRVWARGILVLGTLAVVYVTSGRTPRSELILARQGEPVIARGHSVLCAPDYKADIDVFPGCVPRKCGRMVTDSLVTGQEAEQLAEIGMRGLALGGSEGGATILDLHSGALSKGRHFVNLYKAYPNEHLFVAEDFALYKTVRMKIQHAVSDHFGLSVDALYLTHPTFFSRLTASPPVTPHDEYWHPHVDKEMYKAFHYTSLLYLSDYGSDFEGGRFLFLEKDNSTVVVEPSKGRVSIFTSGRENVHMVERVRSGVRFALTISFSCDRAQAIGDPSATS